MYGPNGEFQLDPDNFQCGSASRAVFATCKNNCPGGELFKFLVEENIITYSMIPPIIDSISWHL